MTAAEDFTASNNLVLLRHYEKEYHCSGICDLPLFYLTQPTSFGPPTEDCVDAVIKSWTDNLAVAAVAVVATFAFWSAALAAIPNCCGAEKPQKAAKKGKHYELSEDISGMNTTR